MNELKKKVMSSLIELKANWICNAYLIRFAAIFFLYSTSTRLRSSCSRSHSLNIVLFNKHEQIANNDDGGKSSESPRQSRQAGTTPAMTV